MSDDKARMAQIVERTAAAAERARAKLGPDNNSLLVLATELQGDTLAAEGMVIALAGDTHEMTGVVDAKDMLRRVELWVEAMRAARQ